MEIFLENLFKAVSEFACFLWGCERKFWQQAGAYTIVAGYTAGHIKNPGYAQYIFDVRQKKPSKYDFGQVLIESLKRFRYDINQFDE